jgi:hypothetical protein
MVVCVIWEKSRGDENEWSNTLPIQNYCKFVGKNKEHPAKMTETVSIFNIFIKTITTNDG